MKFMVRFKREHTIHVEANSEAELGKALADYEIPDEVDSPDEPWEARIFQVTDETTCALRINAEGEIDSNGDTGD